MTFAAKAMLTAFAVVALPELALACDGCIAAQDDAVQRAFIVATGFMTALPLALIGTGVWWLRRRLARLAAEEEAGIVHLPIAPRPGRR